MIKKSHSIRRRIILGFSFFAIFLSLIFSLFNFLFIYTVEDEVFNRVVKQEAANILEQYQVTQKLPSPKQHNIQVFSSVDDLPIEIANLLKEEPNRREIAGKNGQHFHLYIHPDAPHFVLLAEVSSQLIVRPIRGDILKVLVVTSFIMLIVAWLIAYSIARNTINPLTQLANFIERTDPGQLGGDFASGYPSNEIGVLAESLETAMNRIHTFVERERHFTRDASHELRTPIAIIKGALELLPEGKFSIQEEKVIERIRTATVQMEQSINTLLTLAREESDKSHRKEINVLPFVEQAVIQHSHLLDGKSVNVNVDIDNLFKVNSTPGVLSVLLSNLISNAFQYTAEGEVNIYTKNASIVISDSGTGIDESIRDDIYQTLTKGKNSQGFGIGLSIVKRLCEKHDCQINIISSSQGTEVNLLFVQ